MTQKKVHVFSIYGAHYYAQCNDCDWTDGPGHKNGEYRDTTVVRNAIRAHVLKTGHTVTLDVTKTTVYSCTEI